MESPDPCWLRAKPRGAPTAIAAFMYLYPGVHPGVAILISGPNTHTPIIIIIIIVLAIVLPYYRDVISIGDEEDAE